MSSFKGQPESSSKPGATFDNVTSGNHKGQARPTIMAVHGGWQGPEAFSSLIPLLENAGYSVCAPALPSAGTIPALPNFDKDVEVIQHALKSIIESGKNVILVMHSYGAVPGCEALKYFDNNEETGSQSDTPSKGRIIKLVFLAGMVLPVGGSTWAPQKGNEPVPGFDCTNNLITVLDARTRFYNDLSLADATRWVSRMKPHSRLAYASPLTYPGYTFYPCAYLFTTKDAALPLKVQERFAYAAGIKETTRVDAGHSPHISRPAFVEKFIRKCAGEQFSVL